MLIVGDGPERSKLEATRDRLGLNKNIIFLGKEIEKVHELMLKSEVFVLPSRCEAFGIVFGEALMSGIPCIGTKYSGGPDKIINHGINGFLVESDDIKELSYYMKKLHDNYDSFNNKQIRQQALDKFRTSTFQNLYRKIYANY